MMAFTVSTALSSSFIVSFHFITNFIQSMMVIKKINFQLAKPIVQYLYMKSMRMMRNIATLCFFYLFISILIIQCWTLMRIDFSFYYFFYYFSYGLRSLHVLWLLYTLLNYSFTFIFNANFSKRIFYQRRLVYCLQFNCMRWRISCTFCVARIYGS
jgi:hypothetical protein